MEGDIPSPPSPGVALRCVVCRVLQSSVEFPRNMQWFVSRRPSCS